jgi:hypothetical protein
VIEVVSLTTAHFYPFGSVLQRMLALVVLLFFVTIIAADAQTPSLPGDAADALLSLPDAPVASSSREGELAKDSSDSSLDDSSLDSDMQTAGAATSGTRANRRRFAQRTDITIEPGQVAPRLTAQDKISIGLKQSFTLFSLAGWLSSAGYSQLTNGSPNYGTDSGAFGERLGATALRSTTQNIFTNAVFAPLFHEDPRYYELGRGHKFFDRVFHAVIRPLVTKSDDGRSRPNYSLLSGDLAGAILTNAYYPSRNRGFGQTTATFGTSLGGSAVGYVVTEFMGDALRAVHLEKLASYSNP